MTVSLAGAGVPRAAPSARELFCHENRNTGSAAGKLSLRTLRQIASGSVLVALDSATLPAIRASRSAVQRPSITALPPTASITGFGKLAKTHIAHDQLERLQTNLVHSHAVGTGGLLRRCDRAPYARAQGREPRARLFRRADPK